MPRKQSAKPESLTRAKRLFIANFILFVCLIAAWLIFGRTGAPGSTALEADIVIPPEKQLSLPEQAYLKGQMDALSEHPMSMPEFEDEWVRNICLKMIERDTTFDGASDVQIKEFVEEYYRGYSERFEEYFDSTAARNLGYGYGLKFDPTIRPFPSFVAIQGELALHKEKLVAKFELDEPEWLLFVKAFDQGFKRGYYQIKEGVTADTRTPIRLDFD